jgi:hypothetical protein
VGYPKLGAFVAIIEQILRLGIAPIDLVYFGSWRRFTRRH